MGSLDHLCVAPRLRSIVGWTSDFCALQVRPIRGVLELSPSVYTEADERVTSCRPLRARKESLRAAFLACRSDSSRRVNLDTPSPALPYYRHTGSAQRPPVAKVVATCSLRDHRQLGSRLRRRGQAPLRRRCGRRLTCFARRSVLRDSVSRSHGREFVRGLECGTRLVGASPSLVLCGVNIFARDDSQVRILSGQVNRLATRKLSLTFGRRFMRVSHVLNSSDYSRCLRRPTRQYLRIGIVASRCAVRTFLQTAILPTQSTTPNQGLPSGLNARLRTKTVLSAGAR
jgi:hypothetical protein